MVYAAWNPVPWLLFLLGVAVCVVSVKAFHRKYPEYPFGNAKVETHKAEDLMIPINAQNVGSLPRSRVTANTSVSVVQELLANGVLTIGVESDEGNLDGQIGPMQVGVRSFEADPSSRSSVILGR